MPIPRVRPLLVAGVVALAALALAATHFHTSLPLIGHRFEPARDDDFVCPMDPDVRQSSPGTCPKCGMDLVRESTLAAPPSAGHATHAESGADEVASPLPLTDPRAPVELDLRRRQLIGVRLVSAETTRVTNDVRATGTVQVDETRLRDVNVRVEGYVRRLHVNATGIDVSPGTPLLTLYSPELVATQREYLLALKTREQSTTSAASDAAAYAERLVAAARQRLDVWDLPAAEFAALEQTRMPRESITIAAPVAGTVIEKRVVEGMRVMPGESLYRLADLSTVWVETEVFERDLPAIRPGAPATVTVDAAPGESFRSRVSVILPAVSSDTRTARVRFTLPNRGRRLRPGMFATVVLASTPRSAVTVPTDALVDTGLAQFVFVSQGDGYFEPRPVEAGARVDGRVEIRRGLADGDRVAGAAAFLIDSESQLRAAMLGYTAADDRTAAGTGATSARYAVALRTAPDPPRNGDNTFVVTVRDVEGRPVEDATVAIRLYMAPMPSMNMPAMKSDVAVLHATGGEYRGQGRFSMAGRWDATVTVIRDGAVVATHTTGVTAR